MALDQTNEQSVTAIAPEVFIVGDHLTVRRGLELLLRDAGFGIAGVAGVAQAAARLARRRHDLVLLEVTAPGGGALALARSLLGRSDPALLVLCADGAMPGPRLRAADELGAPGFVLTSSPPQVLVDALRTVTAGGRARDPALDRRLAAAAPSARLAVLTRREREVLSLLAQGCSGPEIADRLVLSTATVRTHVGNATTKLGARTRVEAVALVVAGEAPDG